jgi:hypothetical protein
VTVAIIWLTEAEAENKFKDTLVEWHLAHNYKGCYSPGETQKYVMSFFSHRNKQSPTARQLYEYVLLNPKKIYVLGMRGGFQCFDSTAGEQKDMPVIFIDVDGKLEIFVRAPHGVSLGTTRESWKGRAESQLGRPAAQILIKRDYQHANKVSMADPQKLLDESRRIAAEAAAGQRASYDYDMGNRVSLDNRIAALHEFGHAKQWLECPMLFDQQKRMAPSFSSVSIERSVRSSVKPERIGQIDLAKRDAALRLGGSQRDVRLADSRAGFAKDLQAAAEKFWTRRGGGTLDPNIRTAKDVETFEEALKKAPVWGRAIEMDNMERHEWPICRELGVPIRSNYRDLDATTTAQASLTTQIVRLAENKRAQLAKEEEERKRKEVEAAAIAARSKQAAVCSHPGCGMTFPNQGALRAHFNREHL